jgi:hypothetical protein
MTYQPNPLVTDGGQEFVRTSDAATEAMLTKILDELKHLTLMVSIATDTNTREE